MEQNTNPLPQVETPEMLNPPTPTPPVQKPKSRLVPLLLILGLVMLVAVPALYFVLNQPAAPTPIEQAVAPALPTPVPFFLEIENPKADVTAVNGEVLVSGRTFPSTTVIIYTDTDEAVIESDLAGHFEETVLVGENGGLLKITAYAGDGEELSETFAIGTTPNLSSSLTAMSVFASSEVIAKNDNTPNPNKPEVKTENKTIKTELLAQTKTKNVLSDPKVKAFLSVKTTPKKIEKLGPEQLKKMLASGSTESGTPKKTGKPDKTATASAKLNLKKMEAQQASAGATLKRHAISGIITEIADGSVTIAHQIKRDRITTVFYNTATIISMKGIESTSPAILTVGMRIVAVGEPVENGILAKRIHVIPGKATGVFTKNPVATKSGDASKSAEASDSAKLTLTITPTPSGVAPSPSSTPTPTHTPKPSPTTTPTTTPTPATTP